MRSLALQPGSKPMKGRPYQCLSVCLAAAGWQRTDMGDSADADWTPGMGALRESSKVQQKIKQSAKRLLTWRGLKRFKSTTMY
jgi:hypothetical protein